MSSWNGLDFIIFLIFVLNAVLGASRGVLRELTSAMCLSAALIIMIKFTVPLAAFFNSSPLITTVVESPYIQNFMNAINAGPLTADFLKEIFYCLSLLVCFVGAFSICEAGLARVGFIGAYSFSIASLNRIFGFSLGFVRGYVIVLITLLIITLHLFTTQSFANVNSSFIQGSYFANLFQNATKRLDEIIANQHPDQYREIFKDRNLYTPDMLRKTLDNGTGMSSEQQMFRQQPAQPNSK